MNFQLAAREWWPWELNARTCSDASANASVPCIRIIALPVFRILCLDGGRTRSLVGFRNPIFGDFLGLFAHNVKYADQQISGGLG
jgi:hypothetical protein